MFDNLERLYTLIDKETDGGKWDFCYNVVHHNFCMASGTIIEAIAPANSNLATATLLYYALDSLYLFEDWHFDTFADKLLMILNLPPRLLDYKGGCMVKGTNADFAMLYHFLKDTQMNSVLKRAA